MEDRRSIAEPPGRELTAAGSLPTLSPPGRCSPMRLTKSVAVGRGIRRGMAACGALPRTGPTDDSSHSGGAVGPTPGLRLRPGRTSPPARQPPRGGGRKCRPRQHHPPPQFPSSSPSQLVFPRCGRGRRCPCRRRYGRLLRCPTWR